MINIIAGKYKKTKLLVPKKNVRPTSSIKKEAIFSILESLAIKKSYKPYTDKCFIDLFAGSGSLGLEAISRGASFCYFYENDLATIEILIQNCKKISKNDKYQVINENILTTNFKINPKLISAIFIDPPYNINPFEKILNNIKKNINLTKQTYIIIETQKNTKITIPDNFKIFNLKFFGKTKIIFLQKI